MKTNSRSQLEALDGLSIASFTSHEDDTESNSRNEKTGSAGDSDVRQKANLLRKDKRIVMIRAIALCVLFIASIVVSGAVYTGLRAAEQREFENIFDDQSTHIGQAIKSELELKLRALDGLSVTMTSYAGSRVGNWPNISLPEFSYRSASTLKIGRGISIAIQPIVHKENLNQWEEFSIENQGWRREGLIFQTLFPDALSSDPGHDRKLEDDHSMHTNQSDHGGLVNTNVDPGNVPNISELIFRVTDGIPTRAEEDIMIPVWQHSPVHEGLPWVNYDLYSKEGNKGALLEVVENKKAVLGRFFELSESSNG